jgi:Na+-driven multidrug efflux pump
MYQVLLSFHSLFRWLVLTSLLYALLRALHGYYSARVFTPADNAVRHWTATIAHIQLMLGIVLYTQSPVVRYFLSGKSGAAGLDEPFFYGVIHIALMILSIMLLTVGSALAKRKENDRDKFVTMLLWFGLALFLILLAIPWPFSPLAKRPFLRPL